jgi:hypothetical protein
MSSEQGPPNPQNPPPPPPSGTGSGCLSAIMVLFGIVLLLPGLCAILLFSSSPGSLRGAEQIVLMCGLAAAAGIALIVAATRVR